MCTFNRNNRLCIHLLQHDKKFIDFTEEEDYYLCNDELNTAGIEQDDLVKFRLLNDDNTTTQRIYGFVKYIENTNHTTFMICEHYDENSEPFYLDYAYSSFYHAFRRLNHHGSFSDWNQLTHIKFAHAPQWFVKNWIDEHVTTDETEEEFEGLEEDVIETDEQNKICSDHDDLIDTVYNIQKQIDVLNNKLATHIDKIYDRLNNSDEKQKDIKDTISELSTRVDIIGKTAVQAYTKPDMNPQKNCYHYVMC